MKVSRAICITAILILVLVFLIPAKVSAQEEDWSKERIKVSLGPPLSTQPKVIEVEKIKENEYNLSLTLYIFPGEEVGRLMQLRIGKTCHRLKREF